METKSIKELSIELQKAYAALCKPRKKVGYMLFTIDGDRWFEFIPFAK